MLVPGLGKARTGGPIAETLFKSISLSPWSHTSVSVSSLSEWIIGHNADMFFSQRCDPSRRAFKPRS